MFSLRDKNIIFELSSIAHLTCSSDDFPELVCPVSSDQSVLIFTIFMTYATALTRLFRCADWSEFLVYLVVVVALLFYVHDKHVRSCRDGQLT